MNRLNSMDTLLWLVLLSSMDFQRFCMELCRVLDKLSLTVPSHVAAVTGAASDNEEDDEVDINEWDTPYREFNIKLDGLLRTKIHRQYHHLNFVV